ncbi:hypothetical protein D3C76_1639340 [compost metagenome]
MREVALKRSRAMLFSNRAIISTPATSLSAAITTASSKPVTEKCVTCPHGKKTPTNICSTTSCLRLMPHFSTAKP